MSPANGGPPKAKDSGPDSGANGGARAEPAVDQNGLVGARAQVVVVGAGLAGLAAAQRLHERGLADVILLEAQSRVGGRVHTISHSDYLLELGAQWLHGADENPLYHWFQDKNMLEDLESGSLGYQGLFCSSTGEKVDQALVKRVLEVVIKSKLLLFRNQTGDEGCQQHEQQQVYNASQVFRRQLELELAGDDQLGAHKELVYAIFDWFLRYENIENGCDSMDDVSISSYTDWVDWGDGALLNFRQGYRSLLSWFCQQIPTGQWLRLNKQVVNIEMLTAAAGRYGWLDEHNALHAKPILVRYTEVGGDAKTATLRTIECDHVIVTVSVGYLKKNHRSLFKPQLPQSKQELIEALGFGTVNKILLEFERPFWDDLQGIKVIWLSQVASKFPSWIKDVIAFDVVRKQPNMLIGWIGGAGAREMEQHCDYEITQTCLRLLESCLPAGHKRPTKLLSYFCSRWHSNPFTCGSYSFQSTKSYDMPVDKLHEPVYSSPKGNCRPPVPRILFAGEATAGQLYSTTHGAIVTGWREADRLADLAPASSHQKRPSILSELVADDNIHQVSLSSIDS